MELNNKIIYPNHFFLALIFIFLYHYYIQNEIEKRFSLTYLPYNKVKRPLQKCDNDFYKSIHCIGMPSGHAEAATIILCLLYYYKYISIWLAILFIFIFSIQRIIIGVHTLLQVLMGILVGLIYYMIYISFNLTLISFLIVFAIGVILLTLIKQHK